MKCAVFVFKTMEKIPLLISHALQYISLSLLYALKYIYLRKGP